MARTSREGRLEGAGTLIGAVFVPLGLICLTLRDYHPHVSLWPTLAIVFLLIGTPSSCVGVLLRWRRRRHS